MVVNNKIQQSLPNLSKEKLKELTLSLSTTLLEEKPNLATILEQIINKIMLGIREIFLENHPKDEGNCLVE